MEKNEMSDFVSFENDCEAFLGIALSKSSLVIESLNLNKIQQNERAGRISQKIEDIINEIYLLNRPSYIQYFKDTPSLYKLFKSTNRLNNRQEMGKLQKAMILKLTHDCLLMLMMETDIREHVSHFFATGEMLHERNGWEPGMHPCTLPGHHHALATGLQPAAVKGDKSTGSTCLLGEDILFFIIVLLNQRLHFLMNESSIEPLIHWIMFPKMDQEGVQIVVDCKTNECRCIMDHFKVYNPSITYANMERYGHFISRQGKPITASCMGSSTYDGLNTRHAIDHIFSLVLKIIN